MMNLVFFLEGPSEKAMLEGLLPRLLPADIYPLYVVFEGKQDLERQAPKKIQAWQMPNTHFVIVRDQDSGNCFHIKQTLLNLATHAGRPDTLVRIACHELESWYLGDLHAVAQGLDIPGLEQLQNQRKFRDPDLLANAAQELERLTQHSYSKLAGSRAIGPYLNTQPEQNRSISYQFFIKGLLQLTRSE